MYYTPCKFNSTVDNNKLFKHCGQLSVGSIPKQGKSQDMLALLSAVKPQGTKVYNVYSFGSQGQLFLVHEDNPNVSEAVIYGNLHIKD